MYQDEVEKDLYKELNLTPPQHLAHLTEEELREAIKIKTSHNWKQVGQMLTCTCDIGKHTSKLPTTHILKGTDDAGNPILEKVVY